MNGPGLRFRTLMLWGLASAGVLVAGCRNGNNGQTSATDTAATAATSTARASGATTGATSAGEVAPSPEITSWSDNNIVAKLAMADRGEVELGGLAEHKATTSAVRDFARLLVTDHSKHEGETKTLEKNAKLPAKTPANDTTAKQNTDLMKKFSDMPKGLGFDSAFVQHEIDDHTHDIADAKAMQAQAKDAQLKNLLANTIPVMQKHLDAAKDALGKIGSASATDSATGAATQSRDTGATKTRRGRYHNPNVKY